MMTPNTLPGLHAIFGSFADLPSGTQDTIAVPVVGWNEGTAVVSNQGGELIKVSRLQDFLEVVIDVAPTESLDGVETPVPVVLYPGQTREASEHISGTRATGEAWNHGTRL